MSCSSDYDCISFYSNDKCCFGTCTSSTICNDVRGISTGIIIAIAVGSVLSFAACVACCICCCRNNQRRLPQAYTTTTVATTVPQQQFVQPRPAPFHGQQPSAGYPTQQQAYPPQASYPPQTAYPPQPTYPPQQQHLLQNANSGQMAYPPQPALGQEYTQPATNPNFKPLLDAEPKPYPSGPPPPYQ